MYRKVLIYTSVLVALCACQKEVDFTEMNERQISFTSVNFGMETKAETQSAFPTSRDLGVFAWRSNAAWSTDPELTSYISNVQSTYDATKTVWTTTYRWPVSTKKLHFLCYSPYSSTSPISWTKAGGLAITGYTSNNVDLCYSDFTFDQSREEDVEADPANILMRHALAKVSFALSPKAEPEVIDPNVTSIELNIVSITLSGLKNTGNFAASLATDGTGKWTGAAWSSQTGSASYTYSSGLIVMPQTLTDDVQKVKVKYTITTTYTSDTAHPVTSGEIEETHDLKCAACGSWAINNHYIYTLKLDAFGDEIIFDPDVADWDENINIIKIGYEDATI